MYGNGRHAINHWSEFLLNLQAYLLVSAVSAIAAVLCLVSAPAVRRRLLPIPWLRPGRWGGGEVVMALLTFRIIVPFAIVFILIAIGASLPRNDAVGSTRLGIYVSPLHVALTLALVITHLYARSRTRPHHLGLTWARWQANAVLGVATFLIATPVVLGIDYYLTTQWFNMAPRPVEQAVRGDFPAWGWALLIFMTVVGAPLLEETMFRGVLQGWLRRASLVGHGILMMVVLVAGATPLATYWSAQLAEGEQKDALVQRAAASALDATPPLMFAAVLVAGYGVLVWLLWSHRLRIDGPIGTEPPHEPRHAPADTAKYVEDASDTDDAAEDAHVQVLPRAPMPHWPHDPAQAPQERAWAWANARLAIYGSAMLFAMGHETWPDPIPLFLLGLALGWLAYRTQSLVGPIVCHGLFNAVACIVLAWSV